jgi:hypothetical protein
MKKGRILAVLFLTLLLTFSLGFAWGPRGYWGRYAGYGPWYLNPPLSDLTQEQIRKIGDLREKFLKEIAPLQEKLFAKRMELRSLWLSRDLDERKINALQREIIDLRAKIAQKAGELRLEISKVLTPEQREKLSLYGPWRGCGRFMMP